MLGFNRVALACNPNIIYRRSTTGALTRLCAVNPSRRYSVLIDNPVWKLGILNHVAIATPNIEKSASFYKNVLRAQVSDKVALPEHGVYTVFIDLGNTKLELLEPLGEQSPIANFLAKNKSGGMHHICIEVDDIYKAIRELKDKGVRALDPQPKTGAHGLPVVFLHPKDCGGVLVELEEKKRS